MSAAVAELSETQAHAERLLTDKHALEGELHRLKAGLREAGLAPENFMVALPGAAAFVPRGAAEEAGVGAMAPAESPRPSSPSVRHAPSRSPVAAPMQVPEAARALMRPTAKSITGSRPGSPATPPRPFSAAPPAMSPSAAVKLDPSVLLAGAAAQDPATDAPTASARQLSFAGDGTVTVRFDSVAGSAPLPDSPVRKASASCGGALQSPKAGRSPSPPPADPATKRTPSSRSRWPKLIQLQQISPSALLPDTPKAGGGAAGGVKPKASPLASALNPVGPLQASSTHRSSDMCARDIYPSVLIPYLDHGTTT